MRKGKMKSCSRPWLVRGKQCLGFYEVVDVIKLCSSSSSSSGNIVNAMVGHSLAVKFGCVAHLPTSTSVLVGYSRAGDLSSSLRVFNEIDPKDVIIWNAMMCMCSEHGCFGDAFNLFRKMVKEGTAFDSTTLVIAISNFRHGPVVHGLSLKSGFLSHSFVSNSLIHMYAKLGDFNSSKSMFVETHCKDLISWNSIMSAALANNEPHKCVTYFRQMVRLADSVSLCCAISACNRVGEFGCGQLIHGLGIKLGYGCEVSIANALISLYSRQGDIDGAYTVFTQMYPKDVISWNSMMDGFASNGYILEAFQLLHQMEFQPDTVTILTILPFCAELMLLRQGKTVHGFALKTQLGSHLSIVNSLLDMYLKCHSLKAAQKLFDKMPNTDLVSWNTMISGYSQTGHFTQAQALFKKLLQCCSQCSLPTLLAILPSCRSPQSLHLGKSLHSWHLKLGFSNNILARNSLISMYIDCGDLVASFSLFKGISVIADTVSWNTIITGCTQNGHFQESLEAFDLMRQKSHVTSDAITLLSVISACGNLGLVFQGKLSHGLALKTLIHTDIHVQNALITMYGRFREIEGARLVFDCCTQRNLCSWNCMISAFSQNNDAKRALKLFRCLDFEPNEITISTILSACTQLGVIRHGKQIHGNVFRSGSHKNSFINAALVDMYSNCGRLDISLRIFQYSHEKSVAAWNSMIAAYGFHSDGRKAIDVFKEMIEFGIIPTKTTFINLLSACSHSGLVTEGLCYYDNMLDEYGVQPVAEHHVCIVDMLGRSGRLVEAYDFVRGMLHQPEPGIWGALLSACNYHGDIEMGRKVADILFGLEPKNVGYYVSLSNMYVAAGRWSDAVEIRAIIENKRLQKPAGYSLIDLGLG